MDTITKVKSKETIQDQYDVVRLLAGKEYVLLHERNDSYLIIDEIGHEIFLGKEYFYKLKDYE